VSQGWQVRRVAVTGISCSSFFTSDAFGRVTHTTFPSSFYEFYAYDAIGNLTSETGRSGQTIQYVHDLLTRLLFVDQRGIPFSEISREFQRIVYEQLANN
jgi:YD repeat-containing protein